MSEISERLSAALSDRYRIERELGEGGMATVYLADDLKHERKVAIKVLRPELAAVVGAERFLSEIRTTANLQHPHILPLFDSGEADSFLYYVMPYVEGETLRDRINREKQLPVDTAVSIARKVASALDYAHRHGVIHRDIKPANILVQDGEPQVADFGIALAVQSAGSGRLTETGLSLGTPFYMSPEQATGDRDPDPRSDQYSLGCVTFEMLTGDPPFKGSTAQSVLAQILTGEAPVVTKVRKTVPTNVASALAKATQRLPADRFGTVAEFGEALANPGFRFGAAADAGGVSGSGARSGSSSSALWKAATAVLSLIVVGLAATTFLGAGSNGDTGEPMVLRVVLPDSQALAHPLDVMSTALSDDGRTLVYSGPGPGGQPMLWVKRRDERLPTPLPGTEGVSAFDVSPDGSEVALIGGANRQLRIVPAAGGTPRVMAEDVSNRGLHWGEDGFIYIQNANAAISRVSTADGSIEFVTGRTGPEDTSTPELTWPWLLPGGTELLVTRWGSSGSSDSVAVVDIASGEQTVLARGNIAQFMPPSHLLVATNDGTLTALEYELGSRQITGAGAAIADDVRSLMTASVDFYAGADGTLLYAAGAGNTRTLAWVDREGNSTGIRDEWEGDLLEVALSPDGSRIAATLVTLDRADIWVVPVDEDTPPQRITFNETEITRPVWHPGGDSILFMGIPSGGGPNVEINQLQWNGIGTARVVATRSGLNAPANLNEVLVSLDGEYLIYRTGSGDVNRDIYAVRRNDGGDWDTSNPIEIAASEASEAAPALSRDTRFIAYVSNESGREEIHVRTFPDVTGGKWIVSTAGGIEPQWSLDGSSLFYRETGGSMMEVDWDTRNGGGVLGRRELFDANRFLSNQYHPSFAVHPDGRFLMLEAASEDQIGLIWVQNFPAMLSGR